MKIRYLQALSGALGVLILSLGQALAADKTLIERGRYLVKVAGCNDCHTPAYMMKDGKVPEALWLTGDSFGWNGPWGTTYATNLRLYVKDMSEAEWIKDARTMTRRPPMPWFNLNAMNDKDLRAIYQYIKSLGAPGQPAPAALPPGVEPPMPYMTLKAPPPPVEQAKK